MHSSSVLLALTIAASSASAAPLGAREFDSRSLSSDIVPLLKKLGLGVAAGAGTTALGDVLGGSSDSSAAPASKRDNTTSASDTSLADLLMKYKFGGGHGPAIAPNFTDILNLPISEGPIISNSSDLALRDIDARGLSSEIVPLLKKLGLGIAAGAGTTALGDVLGGSSDSSAAPASRRDVSAASLADLIEKLQQEAGSGQAAPSSPNNAGLAQRDIDARGLSSEIVPLLKKLGLGIAAGAGTTALGDVLGGSDSSSAAAAPAATPASKRDLTDFEARGLGSDLLPLLKKLGIGAAAGAGTTILGDALGGSDSSSAAAPAATAASKRDLTDFEARGLGSDLLPLLKKLGIGAAAGAGTTILGDALGGSDSSSAAAPAATPASRRDFIDFDTIDARSLGSALGKVLGATEDDIGTVLKNGAIGGAVTGGVVSAGDAIENAFGGSSSKRDVDIRSLGSALGKVLGTTEDDIGTVLKNGAIGGAVTGGVVSAGDAIKNAFGGSDSKREIDERAPLNLSPVTKGIIGTLTGLAASSGIEGLFDPSSKREIDERAPLNLSPITKGLIGTITGLAASSGVEALFDPSSDSSSSRRSIDYSDVDTATLVALQKLASRALNELD